MSRENRTDKMEFTKKEDAVSYAKELNLVGCNLYVSPEGIYKVKKYTKVNGEKAIGRFTSTSSKDFTYFDYSEPVVKKPSNGTKNKNFKDINGEKLKKYIEDNGIDKSYLCDLLYRSRSFINDAIKGNRMDSLCLEKLCEFFNVNYDYFDIKEEVKEDLEENTKDVQYDCSTIHDDLMVLIASNKRLVALMSEMIRMWRND